MTDDARVLLETDARLGLLATRRTGDRDSDLSADLDPADPVLMALVALVDEVDRIPVPENVARAERRAPRYRRRSLGAVVAVGFMVSSTGLAAAVTGDPLLPFSFVVRHMTQQYDRSAAEPDWIFGHHVISSLLAPAPPSSRPARVVNRDVHAAESDRVEPEGVSLTGRQTDATPSRHDGVLPVVELGSGASNPVVGAASPAVATPSAPTAVVAHPAPAAPAHHPSRPGAPPAESPSGPPADPGTGEPPLDDPPPAAPTGHPTSEEVPNQPFGAPAGPPDPACPDAAESQPADCPPELEESDSSPGSAVEPEPGVPPQDDGDSSSALAEPVEPDPAGESAAGG